MPLCDLIQGLSRLEDTAFISGIQLEVPDSVASEPRYRICRERCHAPNDIMWLPTVRKDGVRAILERKCEIHGRLVVEMRTNCSYNQIQ